MIQLNKIIQGLLAVLAWPVYFVARVISAAIYRSRSEYELRKQTQPKETSTHAPK